MRCRLLPISTALLAALVTALPAQDPGPRLDSLFAPWNRDDSPGCAVGVRRGGTDLLRKAYGMANLEDGVPLTAESVLESGSVAKQFTAATIGLLALRGRLPLDDDIRTHLPEVPDFGQTITIRHLLHHTSGLRDQWGLLSITGNPPGRQVHTFPLILDLVSRQRMLNFRPGEEYLYSNTGYALAAIIVSRVAGKPFAQFSQEELFTPLGMTHTQWRDDFRRIVPGRATAYDREQGAWVQDMPFTNVHGNGGLLTTVGDLLIWNDALTSGRIPGGPELVRMLETRGTLNDGSEIRYALGLGIGNRRGLREVSHSGSTAGYQTYLARWPERGLSVAVLCNSGTANPGRDAGRIADLVLGLDASDPAPPSPAVPVAAAELEALAGTYRDSTTDQVLTLAVREGRLVVSGSGPGAPLTHLGGMRFWSPGAGEYRFERAGDRWSIVRFEQAWRRYDPFTRIEPAEVPLGDYPGRYRSPELDVVISVEADTGVVIRPPNTEPIRLVPIYRDGFAAPGRTLRFMRDATGKVTGFRVFAGRVRDLRFERTP